MKKIVIALCVMFGVVALNACSEQLDLAGEWNVETIGGQAIEGLEETPFLSFDVENGRVHGNTGVNMINSTFTQDGKSLKFGLGATTMMAGPEKAMAVEQVFLKAFGEVAAAKMNADKLEFSDADGNVVMVLSRKK